MTSPENVNNMPYTNDSVIMTCHVEKKIDEKLLALYNEVND